MTFTVRDHRDLLQLLNEHPEWREELRRAELPPKAKVFTLPAVAGEEVTERA